MRIDLNADMGEARASDHDGDEALLDQVSSTSIACGLHAGSFVTMRDVVERAHARGVAIGAHPSFPDLDGFGRREMHLPLRDVEALVLYQVGALAAIASAAGARLQHVKPHGALYNMAARDLPLALAVARAVHACDPRLILVGLAGSALLSAAAQVGLSSAAEGFADRAYLRDGTLVPRSEPGAVLHDGDAVRAQARRLATDGEVVAVDGTRVPLRVDTICVHGDTPGAVALASAVRSALAEAGVSVMALRPR